MVDPGGLITSHAGLVYDIMEVIEDSTKWALARGVKLNGIAAHRFPGRGLGVVAEKKLKAGEVLLTASASGLRTIRTIPARVLKIGSTGTVHGLLAAELATDTSKAHGPWRASLPSREDFAESMPLMWPLALQALLPPAALLVLEKQKSKLSTDWAVVSSASAAAALPTLSYESYLHAWLLVNTRTFYYTSPKVEAREPFNPDDCMALIPFADYFNHADVGCNVTFSAVGYEIRAHRDFEVGEEIHISYGNHHNDLLLVEYGFILAENNKWDEIPTDEVILPLFSTEQKERLKDENFWGGFVLDANTVCYRTQVALRLLCMPVKKWRRSLASGFEDGDKYQPAVDRLLLIAFTTYLHVVRQRLQEVAALDQGLSSQRETLKRRWEQMGLLLTTAITRIEG